MGNNNKKVIILPYSLSVRELAGLLETNTVTVIRILMGNGVMANINQTIDFDTAAIVSTELGFEPKLQEEETRAEEDEGEIPQWRRTIMGENERDLEERPPVITILGHVDHGKTTLLDAIRKTRVAIGEVGGITQHIQAYQVVHENKLITFVDTPGHAAFSQMRARGAQGADIVILVVAADDGVQSQTREALSHAKAAQVPIIVAITKIDKVDANIDLVKTQLADLGLTPDDWGGKTFFVPVSAKTNKNLDELLATILVVAESLMIKANPKGTCMGTVVEARLDPKQGHMVTLLVQNGTLKVGDVVVAGEGTGKLKAITDQRNKRINKVGPSTPAMVMGLDALPSAGDIFKVVATEREGRQIVAARRNEREAKRFNRRATLEEVFQRMKAGETKELRLLLKSDVQGSLDPIIVELEKLGKNHPEIQVKVLHADAGNISESDVMLAAASEAIVLGFNVEIDNGARRLAEVEGVSVRIYKIIYRLIEDVEMALTGMLEPELVEKVVGRANVLAVFKVSKGGAAAGCRILEGEFQRNGRIRVLRGGKEVFSGEIASIRRERDEVREVRSGMECGITVKDFQDFLPNDVLESFVMERFGG